jgi:hypothetical protein
MTKKHAKSSAFDSFRRRRKRAEGKRHDEARKQYKKQQAGAKLEAQAARDVFEAGEGSQRGTAAKGARDKAKGAIDKAAAAKLRAFDTEASEKKAISEDFAKDWDLIRDYGEDAMKARSFATGREGFKAGGKVKKKTTRKSIRVRGSGVAKQGVRKAKMVTMKGS